MTTIMREPRARDFWLYPLIVVEDVNDTITFSQSPDYPVTISPGVYYAHAQNNTDYPGLYYAIEQAIAATAASNIYEFEQATPLLSSAQTRAGIKITSAVAAWSLKFTGAKPMLPQWFGFPAGTLTVPAVLNASLSVYEVTSNYRARGILRTHTIGTLSGIATTKLPDTEVTANDSHGTPQGRFTLGWRVLESAMFRYDYVYAAHVRRDNAGTLTSYATMGAELAVGDNLSTWEDFWDVWWRGYPALLLPDLEDFDLRIERSDLVTSVHVRYGDPEPFSDMYRRRETSGEAFDIEFKTYIIDQVT